MSLERVGARMSIGQKVIVTVGAFVITFITICTFFKNDISFLLTSRSIERNYGKTNENSYFVEDNFEFVSNYEDVEVHSKKEIIDTIYYLINSGVTYSKRYCAKDYKECYDDMLSISNDANTLSILNNYVHPFNSFESIIFNFDNNVIEIEIRHTYSKTEIDAINKEIDTIINQVITNNMAVREQIKAVHDYIINNTAYDTLKSENIEDKTYKSNTAYGVLIEKFGICSGYSDTMKIFLDKLNIINYKISNDQHIWNLVYLDGTWYHLDLTWDDPISELNITRDNYFLINTNTLQKLDDGLHYFDYYNFLEAK